MIRFLRPALAAFALTALMGASGCEGFFGQQGETVARDTSTAIKKTLCEAGVTLAAAAAEARGISIDDMIDTDVLVAGCRSLADRAPISATVYEPGDDLTPACTEFRVYQYRLRKADDLDGFHALGRIIADAGCPA